MPPLPVIAIVIPVFNEEAVLPALFARLSTIFGAQPALCAWRAVLVDDGSRDRSAVLIRDQAAPGCHVFVADLRRPATTEEAARIVANESASEPEVLQRDYYNSLCAAFEPAEVRAQLAAAGLTTLTVVPEGEHHLMVYGRI